MNRADFMSQLESLLQNIAPTEREEAIQYYNDYFDDAGEENEREVIEALGNPARVAENIKRDLLDSGYGKKPVRNAQASDRALMEYGQEGQESEAESGREAQPDLASEKARQQQEADRGPSLQGSPSDPAQGSSFGSDGGSASAESAGGSWNPFEEYGRRGDGAPLDEDAYRWSHDTAGWFGEAPPKSKKGHMSAWAIALLVTVLIFASPVLGGLAMGVIGILLGWFGTILGFGVAAICLFVVFVVFVVAGILCCFSSPWVGMALIGSGLIVGCLGLLFLMLTVAMAGIVTPAIFRGIASLFRFCKKKRMAWAAD